MICLSLGELNVNLKAHCHPRISHDHKKFISQVHSIMFVQVLSFFSFNRILASTSKVVLKYFAPSN